MLEIRNKVAIKGFLRIEDLDAGELFAFLDGEDIYMKTDFDYWFVDLATGEAFDGDKAEFSDRPVRTLNAELTIKNQGLTKPLTSAIIKTVKEREE